jgi:hypothetical protein
MADRSLVHCFCGLTLSGGRFQFGELVLLLGQRKVGVGEFMLPFTVEGIAKHEK